MGPGVHSWLRWLGVALLLAALGLWWRPDKESGPPSEAAQITTLSQISAPPEPAPETASSLGNPLASPAPPAGSKESAFNTNALPVQPHPPNPDNYRLSSFADVQLDQDPDFGTPHFVRRRSGCLSPPAPESTPDQVLAAFLTANARAFTLHPTDLQSANARVHQDYRTRHNGLRHLRWQQQKDGIDIHGATFSLNLTDQNEILNVSSRALHLPEVRFHRVEGISAEQAEDLAEAHLGAAQPGQPAVLQPSAFSLQPSPIWYPLDMISAVLSWDLAMEAPDGSVHRLIVRGDTGQVVADINLTWNLEDITFHVYTSDSPTPFSPGMNAPTNYAPPEVPRTLLTLPALDVNASPAGWIPVGTNTTKGNNIDTFADWDDDDQPDPARPRPQGSPYRVFNAPLELTQPPRDYTEAAVVQAFYLGNVFHDRLYRLGFDEAAGNFQEDNFDRGGLGYDSIHIHVQDGWSVGRENNANFTAFGDGGRGRMQLYVWTHSLPDRDSALDGEVVFHEAAHGVSTRLIGDGFGLSTTQARGMGEGWSDFLSLSLLSEPGDDPHGTYPYGAYVGNWYLYTNNYYFGLRRFPYSTDLKKAPQTLADTDPNQIAFPADVPMNPKLSSNLEADQIHRIGEIWCLALWECRANLIDRYGTEGNEMMLQLVVDGMKLTPVNPTFVQARDAILQADLVDFGGMNQMALWRGFSKRGLGYSAEVPGAVSTVGMVEGFDLPFGIETTVTERTGDGDGYAEPGEEGELVITLTSHEMGLSNVTAVLSAVSSEVTVTASSTVLGHIVAGGSAASSPPFAFTVSPDFTGFEDAEFRVRIESDQGWFEELVRVRIGNPYDYPPEIFGIDVTNLTETSAWVSWSTGIPADGRVEYGLTTGYGSSTPLDSELRTNHLAELSGLSKGTVYHYRIASRATNGLVSMSADRTFRTRARVYVSVRSTATAELGTVEAPFKTLQGAAEAARATGDEILVAWGTYSGTNSEAVLVLDGVDWDLVIRGGYSLAFSECDPKRYATVIDGQMQRRGVYLDNGASLILSGVTVRNGTHPEWGGGVAVRRSNLAATNCVVTRNVATNGSVNQNGGGLYATLGATVYVADSVISGNKARRGGGVFAVSDHSLCQMMNCQVSCNSADTGGGAGFLLSASGEFRNCVVYENVAEALGGGISVGPSASAAFFQTSLAQNRAVHFNNPELDGGGGVAIAGSSLGPTRLTVNNSVLAMNEADLGRDVKVRDIGFEFVEIHASYSIIGDIYGQLTTSNHLIRSDPRFANPASGDFHLLYGSPCIDAGDPSYVASSFDFDGDPRPFGAAIDMGADEFTDTDADHMADYWERDRFGDLARSDGTADRDADTLNDFEEYMNQTDPQAADTDADLAQDGWEIANGYNPRDPDMDKDGMWDGWEATHALDAFTNDAALDPDTDRMGNLAEFTADTDPKDSNSTVRFLSVGQERGGLRLQWQGGRDAWQFLETSGNVLQADAWTQILGFPPPTPLTNSIIHFGNSNRNLFYRIRAER